MKLKKLLLTLGIGLSLAAASSHAVLITSTLLDGSVTADDPQALPGTVSLNNPALAFLNATGSVGGEKRSPWDTSANNSDTRPYHYVKNGGTITLTLDNLADQIAFVWGSPDSYNTLTLYTAGGSTSIIPGINLPIPVDPINSYLVTITATSAAEYFDKIVFASGSPSFEFANVQVRQVPTPATMGLLLPMLGFIGLLRLRGRVGQR